MLKKMVSKVLGRKSELEIAGRILSINATGIRLELNDGKRVKYSYRPGYMLVSGAAGVFVVSNGYVIGMR